MGDGEHGRRRQGKVERGGDGERGRRRGVKWREEETERGAEREETNRGRWRAGDGERVSFLFNRRRAGRRRAGETER